MSETHKQLLNAADLVHAARRELDYAMAQAKEVALRAIDEGASELRVSRDLGVDRMTIRKWAGKR